MRINYIFLKRYFPKSKENLSFEKRLCEQKNNSSFVGVKNSCCIEGISETPNASADFYCQSNTNHNT